MDGEEPDRPGDPGGGVSLRGAVGADDGVRAVQQPCDAAVRPFQPGGELREAEACLAQLELCCVFPKLTALRRALARAVTESDMLRDADDALRVALRGDPAR